MAEVDIEPVFRTRRQRLVRDVLTAVVACVVLWVFLLGEPPGLRETALFVGGGVVAFAFVVARARGVLPWPDRRTWERIVDIAVVFAVIMLLDYAPTAIAWAGVGVAIGGLAARLLLYATGEWRPGEPP